MRTQQDQKVTVIIFIVSIVTSQHHRMPHWQPLTSDTTNHLLYNISLQYNYMKCHYIKIIIFIKICDIV